MELKYYITKCGEITKAKGFDISQHALQLLLIADEAGEALEHTIKAPDKTLKLIMSDFRLFRDNLRSARESINIDDITEVPEVSKEEYLEELADIFIRWASYVSQYLPDILAIIDKKITKNEGREYKHGKLF